jgi:hypothetical protein
MLSDIELAQIRLDEMQRLLVDKDALDEAVHAYRVEMAQEAIAERQARVEARKLRIREDFEKRSKAAKASVQKRKPQDIAKFRPLKSVQVGFQGEYAERFCLHCDFPEDLFGFDLDGDRYKAGESRFDNIIHALRSRSKDA